MNTMSLHFRVDGKGFLDIVRQVYWYESKTRATELMESIPNITREEWQYLVEGKSQLIGVSVCEDWMNCHQCKDTKTCLQILDKPDVKYQNYLIKEGLTGKISGSVEIIVEDNGKRKLILAPLDMMLNYANTIDSTETQLTIKKYHGGLNQEFVEKLDKIKMDAHERLFESMKLEHGKRHWRHFNGVEPFVQEAIELFYGEVITENKQPSKILVKKNNEYGGKKFIVEVLDYFMEFKEIEK